MYALILLNINVSCFTVKYKGGQTAGAVVFKSMGEVLSLPLLFLPFKKTWHQVQNKPKGAFPCKQYYHSDGRKEKLESRETKRRRHRERDK